MINGLAGVHTHPLRRAMFAVCLRRDNRAIACTMPQPPSVQRFCIPTTMRWSAGCSAGVLVSMVGREIDPPALCSGAAPRTRRHR